VGRQVPHRSGGVDAPFSTSDKGWPAHFYLKCYKNHDNDSNEIGHDPHDPSGQNARAFVNRFYPQYFQFLKVKKVKIPVGL